MIRIENINVYGFDAAIRGMRNPMNSWNKIDSAVCKYDISGSCVNDDCTIKDDCFLKNNENVTCNEFISVGPNDIDLMKRLYNAGTEHRKYLRMIHVSMDINAPLYWWKEFDTYKVGTVANSCSTMHKIHSKVFEDEDFSMEHLIDNSDRSAYFKSLMHQIIAGLNSARGLYLETKDKEYWWQMIQLLPTSYNQRRTVDFNYETVISMIKQRTGHKLDEWNQFVETLKKLPYIREISGL